MAIQWRSLKNSSQPWGRKRLRCMDCNSPNLYVICEPVARRVKTRNAHHLRVIAKCPSCKSTKRINLGAPK